MPDLLPAHVRPTDAFTLRMERDPMLRSTITALAVLDRPPDWDRLVDRIERATRIAPSFRARLVPSPLGVAPPGWVLDPDFDLSWHLRRVQAPAPRTVDTVIELARVAAMAAFDPARPLWEFTLVTGLTEGRAALLMKVHHSLTDGVGGIELAAHVVDEGRRSPDLGPLPDLPAPGAGPGLGESIGFGLSRWARSAAAFAAGAPSAAARVARDPVGTAASVGATAGSLARFARPMTTTLSPLMTDRRLQRHLATLDVPFSELRAAGRSAGATLNDAFLAGVTGGLRRYHEAHSAPVSSLRVTMPINTRKPGDPAGGNRVTLARFEVPVDLGDPQDRMRSIGATCASVRREPALPYSEAVAEVLNLLPTSVTGAMLKHVDFLASNVPGFPVAVYLAGSRIDSFHAFGPTIGASANVTLMSYRGTCHIGVTMDAGAVPDPDRFVECLAEGFDEVLAPVTASRRPGKVSEHLTTVHSSAS